MHAYTLASNFHFDVLNVSLWATKAVRALSLSLSVCCSHNLYATQSRLQVRLSAALFIRGHGRRSLKTNSSIRHRNEMLLFQESHYFVLLTRPSHTIHCPDHSFSLSFYFKYYQIDSTNLLQDKDTTDLRDERELRRHLIELHCAHTHKQEKTHPEFDSMYLIMHCCQPLSLYLLQYFEQCIYCYQVVIQHV